MKKIMQKTRVPCIKLSLTSTYRAYGILLGMLLLIFKGQSLLAQSQSYVDSAREELVERLDSLANANINEGEIAGFSVAVFHGSDTLLLKGYGHADVGLDVPATDSTRYRIASGPAITMLAVLLIRQVEQGRIMLDEDVTSHLSDFPWQGRSVTLRQLMDATSGLLSYHYLGDSYESEIAVPKSLGEVTTLFAGLPFIHEPGNRQQWTISGYHLAGILLERLTGSSFEELIDKEILHPLGLDQTGYCGEQQIISNLATAYESSVGSLHLAAPASPSIFPFTDTVCASASDVAHFYRALRQGDLIQPESYSALTTLSVAGEEALESSGTGRAIGMRIGDIDGHLMTFEYGSGPFGYNSSALDFPESDLTVIVLGNTGGTQYKAFPQNLSRLVFGLPLISDKSNETFPPLQHLPITPEERSQYTGIYRTSLVGFPSIGIPPEMQSYQRTYRVYDENGRLMIQPLGEVPERLFRQGDHMFAYASAPDMRVLFTIKDGRATEIAFQREGYVWKEGPRIEETETDNKE